MPAKWKGTDWPAEIRRRRCLLATYSANTRAMKLGVPGRLSAAYLTLAWVVQDGRCYWCGGRFAGLWGEKFDVEHVFPLSRGGTNHPHNIVLSCPLCNDRKAKRLPAEWFEERRARWARGLPA